MTPDQTKELQDIYSRLGRILQPVPATLEVGKWYKRKGYPEHHAFLKDIGSGCGNYGFQYPGGWTESMILSVAEWWTPSTPAELLPLFIAEAKRLGIVRGANIRREWHNVKEVKCGDSREGYEFNLETNSFYLDGSIVYWKGQWATVLPNKIRVEAGEYTPEQLIEMANKNNNK